MSDEKKSPEGTEPGEDVESEKTRKILLGKRTLRRLATRTGVQAGVPNSDVMSSSFPYGTSRCG